MVERKFDVFLAHNSVDKPQVRAIADELKKRGLNPWLDEEEIAPGRSFQEEIQQAISKVKSAAIFIGEKGLGRWQSVELESFTEQFVDENIPVIPVLLPGVDSIPKKMHFLKRFNWVNFKSMDDADAFDDLVWGITGTKPVQRSQLASSAESYSSPQPKADEVEPKSEKRVDYTKLRDLLAAGNWQEADQETAKVMLIAAERESEGWLRVEDIDNFPCEDLRFINRLWLYYSHGKFGFSIQKQIYKSLDGKRDYNKEVWEDFAERVGWKVVNWKNHSNLKFNLKEARRAHLPVKWCSNMGLTPDSEILTGMGSGVGLTFLNTFLGLGIVTVPVMTAILGWNMLGSDFPLLGMYPNQKKFSSLMQRLKTCNLG